MRVKYYETKYRNEKNGYTFFTVTVLEACPYVEKGLLFCKGIIPIYLKGTPIEIDGEWSGNFFNIKGIKLLNKTKADSIEILNYIHSDLTDKQKDVILNGCDNDIFKLIGKNETEKQLYGLIYNALYKNPKKSDIAIKILEGLKNLKETEEFTKTMMEYGFSIEQIERMSRKKISTKQVFKRPYWYCYKYDIDINLAESIYIKTGKYNKFSMARLNGYLLDSLKHYMNNGSTCITLKELKNIMSYKMKEDIDISVVNACVYNLKDIIGYHKINNEMYIYFNYVWEEETSIVENIKRLNMGKQTFEYVPDFKSLEKEKNIIYNKGQKNSFNILKSSGIKILTGPPGTGKTAVVNGIISEFKRMHKGNIRLAATTGMAAKILSEATGYEAETVNKMLNILPYSNNESINTNSAREKINAELIVVDEVSMLGMKLTSVLLESVRSGATLLLVGDKDQLFSVEYGNILQDFIESGIIEVFYLDKIMRQQGLICENAKIINSGSNNIKNGDNFLYYECDTEDKMIEIFERYYNKDTQVLCPVKKGNISTTSLNRKLQPLRSDILYKFGDRTIRQNDKVILTRTNYEAEYVNGDVGYAVSMRAEGLEIKLTNKNVIVPRGFLSDVDLAYCVTVHKSQGSEYSYVILMLPKSAKCLLVKRLLYTAVTRAKKRVVVISMDNAMYDSISNINEYRRLTLLKERLK